MAAGAIRDSLLSDNPAEIRLALQRVSAVRALFEAGEDLPLEPFEKLDEIFEALGVPGAVVSARALVHLARLARVARLVKDFLQAQREKIEPLWPLAQGLVPARVFEKEIAGAIDVSDYSILDSASPDLRRIRREIERVQADTRKRLQQILQRAAKRDMLQEQLITMRDGRLVLMVKDEFRRKIGGIVHDQSATGQTLFMEPMETVELNNRVRQLQAQEKAEIERILSVLSALAAEHREILQADYAQLIALDAIRARAKYAADFDCHAPVIKDDGSITLYKARHPVLLQKYSSREKVVPLDFELGKKFTTVIITGPNAGGKTVAMKTVGLCVLMARMGLHIPASPDSEIGLMGRIFVDIGDQQSIENDLSTFTSHMLQLQRMLSKAQPQDLVLIDEMGAGTDPDEGSALALAALRALTERKVRVIATTHHGALKAFAHETEGVENASMVFDLETLQPTYRMRLGIPGASYAFDIAERIGLDHAVISVAREAVGTEKGRVENLISDLQEKIARHDAMLEKLQLEEDRLRGLEKLYRERAEQLATHEAKLKEQAVEESEAILKSANAAVEEAIRRIREQQATKEAIKASKARLEAERAALQEQRRRMRKAKKRAPAAAKKPVTAAALTPGKSVLWRRQNARATVLEAPDAEENVHIQVGPLRVRVPLSELEEMEEKRRRHRSSVSVNHVETVAPELSVRGMRAEEALAAVDQYLNEALLSGWQEVRIVHGKGTGALRKAITEFLRSYPGVARFGPARMGEGDVGVTVVTFE